jgi:dihydroflavonol-4-reductase
MKVFVTGGNGFLGSRTVSELVRKGYAVRCLLRKESNTNRIKHLAFEQYIGDISDRQSLIDGMKGCDAVVHLACISSWTDIRQLESQLETIAVEGTRNVLEAVQSNSEADKKIRTVYVSSSAAIDASKQPRVFDELAPYTLSETSLKYSIAKHRAEQVVNQYVTDGGMDIVTVNPCEAYGPNDDGMVTAGNLIEILKESISMVCSGGTSVAHVEDIARGIVLALEKGRTGERYILGGDNLTIAEMSKIVRKLAGKSEFVLTIPNNIIVVVCSILSKLGLKTPVPMDVLDYAILYWFVDSSKAKRELGYEWRPARQTFQDVVQWLLESKRVV